MTQSHGKRRISALKSGIRRHSVTHFLGVLALTVISLPFLEDTPGGKFIILILFTMMLLSAVLAVGGRRVSLVIALVLVLPALLAQWIHHIWPNVLPRTVFSTCGVLFVGFVIGHLLRYILTAPRVDTEVVSAGIATYILMAILWSFAYTLVGGMVPDSYSMSLAQDRGRPLDGFRSLYFSFTTMTTGCYGDIMPASGPARVLAMTQQATGIFYMAVLISRIVSLYSRHPVIENAGPEK